MADFLSRLFGKKNKGKEHVPDLEHLSNLTLSKDAIYNIKLIKLLMNNSFDIKSRDFQVCGLALPACVVYIENLAEESIIRDHILKPLMFESLPVANTGKGSLSLQKIKDTMFAGGSIKEVRFLDETVQSIMSGDTLLCIQGYDTGLIINTREHEGRSIGESNIEPSVKGPQEAFVETLKKNLGLIRKRIRDPNLCLELCKVGERSNTDIVIVSIKGISDEDIKKEVIKRITSVEIDGIIEAEQLGQLISDNPNSIFPLFQTTERPDKLFSTLMEGRIGAVSYGSPMVLIVPVTLPILMQSADDYFENWIVASVIRITRYIALFISILSPSLYISVTSFNPGMLPTHLALSIASTRSGVPFPAIIEAMLMEVILEILQEAGIRLPRVVGQTVSIVGGLVIGQAAVQAGIVSPIMVIIIAVTAICSYALPSYSLGLATRILRFPFMIAAVTFGSYGVSMGLLFLLAYLSSLKSFGVRYLSSLSPYRVSDWKDTVIRTGWRTMIKRPELIQHDDSVRETAGKGRK